MAGCAVDFDARTLSVAKENLKKYPNCAIEYRSIYYLPHQDEFDIAFSIGVVHHLVEPKAAVRRLRTNRAGPGTVTPNEA